MVSGIFFFFQAEDGIRDSSVTGVQTCALPISLAYFNHGGNKQERGEEDHHEESISTFTALVCRSWACGVHADGGAACSSRLAVPRSPEETSSYSRLVLPILRMRKRFSRTAPSATM